MLLETTTHTTVINPILPRGLLLSPNHNARERRRWEKVWTQTEEGRLIKITNNLFVQKTNRSKQSSKCRKSHFMHSKWVSAGGKNGGGGGRRRGSQFSQLRCGDGWGCAYGAGDAECVSRVSDRYEGRGVSETRFDKVTRWLSCARGQNGAKTTFLVWLKWILLR